MLLHFQIAPGGSEFELPVSAARLGNERGLYAGGLVVSTPKNALC